jgi:uncharacterized membrane protein
MRYAAIIILALFGLIELVLRLAVAVVTVFVPVLLDPNFLKPWCFQMAERVLAS